MTTWIALNSTVRFLLKLCALLALVYWGIHTGDSMAEGIVITALAPGAAVFVWWKLLAPRSASWLTDTGRFSGRNGSVRSVGSCPRRRRPGAPGHLIRSRHRPQRQLSPRRAQELITSRLQDRRPRGPRPRHRPRLRARFLRWARCRRPLRVVGAVACGASLWLSITFYDEALHAGPTEPAALTLRYPLLIRDAVGKPL